MHLPAPRASRLFSCLCLSALSLYGATAAAAPPLKTPWMCEETFPVSQAHHTGSHMGKGAMAWDFALPLGTPIVAPAPGTVRLVRQDSTRYGCDAQYAYDANYVIVEFGDGTEGLFMHLEANSSPLKTGDTVQTGDLLGRIGMSGYTCGPHLHFQVQETCDSWWCASVPAEFVEHGDPQFGQALASTNCTQSDEPGEHPNPDDDRITIVKNQNSAKKSKKSTTDAIIIGASQRVP